MRALHQRRASPDLALSEIMARPMPQADSRVLLEEIYRLLLAGNSGVVITHESRPVGLITRSDLMEFYAQPAKEPAGGI